MPEGQHQAVPPVSGKSTPSRVATVEAGPAVVDGLGGQGDAEHAGVGFGAAFAGVFGGGEGPSEIVGAGAEEDAADRLSQEHAVRAEPSASDPDERDRADGDPAPVGDRRPKGEAEIVEGGVGDELGAGEDEEDGDPGGEIAEDAGRTRAGAEDCGDLVLEEVEEERGEQDDGGGEHERVDQGLADAIEFVGAEVLADHWADGAGKREDDAEGDGDDAADDRIAGDRVVAEFGHGGDDIGVAEGGRDIGEDGGTGDFGDAPDVPKEGAGLEAAEQLALDDDAVSANGEHGETCRDRGPGGAFDAKGQAEDQDGIEHGVDEAAGERGGHGEAGSAHGAESAAASHGERQDGHGRDDDLKIVGGELVGAAFGAEQA